MSKIVRFDVIAVHGEIRSAVKFEIAKRLMDCDQEFLCVLPAATGHLQRKLKNDVSRGEVFYDFWRPRVTPEAGKPTDRNGLVFQFL